MQEPTIKDFRHRAEMPLLVLGYVLTALVSIGCLVVLSGGGKIAPWAMGVLGGLASPVFAVIAIRYLYFQKISNGVELGKKQLPELYDLYEKIALEMGFSKDDGKHRIPHLYLVNGNGVLNAFAAKCSLHKKYVVIHSDIVDVAYLHNNFNLLRYVLAHELAHVKCGHVNLIRTIVSPIMTILLLNKSLTRAQEYTADRVAAYYAPDDVGEMIYLYSGKHLGKEIDLKEYLISVEKFERNLWLRIVNFMSDHAVGYRRIKALEETKEKGWNVHGKML